MTIFTPAYQREATMECFYRTLITDVYSFIGKCLCAGVYARRLFAFKKNLGLYILLCHVKTKSKKLSYTFDRCQQCGICYAVCPENAISLSLRHDGLHDIKINAALCIACGKCVRSCPANKEYGYEGYFDGFAQKKYYLGYHADNRIRRESSSGGVCKTLIIDSLKEWHGRRGLFVEVYRFFPFCPR